MIRIWVTRSEPGATRLGEALTGAGYCPIVEPVLRIRETHDPRPQVNADLHVFLSGHAVRLACNHGWRPSETVAVGPSTASVLRRFGVCAHVPESHDSEGVIDLIRSRYADKRKIMLVCGRGGRAVIRDSLIDEPMELTSWEVYERAPDDSESEIGLKQGDCVCVASTDGMEIVAEMWNLRCRVDPAAVHMVVPSKRVAPASLAKGFKSTLISHGASIEATLSTLNGIVRQG